ncbi:hypothetical protein [Marmoricola sp. RAF53]|uniref:hypothetical protein n=1 Tax=Marmoricola sp. RAF53 TaxID=3233059 RepID=UPI003F94D701
MTSSSQRLAAAVGCASALVLVTALALAFTDRGDYPPSSYPHARVVAETGGDDGWKTIEYRGVRVDVPWRWRRVDMTGCEFSYERWAPPGTTPCRYDGGVGFFGSATFDPAYGPGVRRSERTGSPAWGGWTDGNARLVVDAGDEDREVVATILGSVTPGSADPGGSR